MITVNINVFVCARLNAPQSWEGMWRGGVEEFQIGSSPCGMTTHGVLREVAKTVVSSVGSLSLSIYIYVYLSLCSSKHTSTIYARTFFTPPARTAHTHTACLVAPVRVFCTVESSQRCHPNRRRRRQPTIAACNIRPL